MFAGRNALLRINIWHFQAFAGKETASRDNWIVIGPRLS
jgi:hypothetical protein